MPVPVVALANDTHMQQRVGLWSEAIGRGGFGKGVGMGLAGQDKMLHVEVSPKPRLHSDALC